MSAYYNEHDPVAAEWLRELIKAGHIAPGVVDERSIEDVTPNELTQYTQCHFFAGIGIWSHALRLAGWPDDRPVWTGSCPCQPFSAAGKGEGLDDERHLWPAFFHLIRFAKPRVVFGEQVASRGGLGWLDIVHSDLEAEGYAFAAVDLCAAGFGSPQIRQRLFFVADAQSGRRQQRYKRLGNVLVLDAHRADGGMADAHSDGRQRLATRTGSDGTGDDPRERLLEPRADSDPFRMADTDGRDACTERQQRGGQHRLLALDGGAGKLADTGSQRRKWRQGTDPRQFEHRTDAGRTQGHGEPADAGKDGAFELADAAIGRRGVVGHSSEPRRGGHVDGDDLAGGMVDAAIKGLERHTGHGDLSPRSGRLDANAARHAAATDDAGGMADARSGLVPEPRRRPEARDGLGPAGTIDGLIPGPTNGFWAHPDWLRCRDDKWRPVEAGTFPLADGNPARMGRLRGYGNAISPWPAKAVIEAYQDSCIGASA